MYAFRLDHVQYAINGSDSFLTLGNLSTMQYCIYVPNILHMAAQIHSQRKGFQLLFPHAHIAKEQLKNSDVEDRDEEITHP